MSDAVREGWIHSVDLLSLRFASDAAGLCYAFIVFMVWPQLNCSLRRRERSSSLSSTSLSGHKLSYTIQEKRSNSNISDGVGLALHLFFSLAQENNRLVILRVLALKWNGEKISTSEKDENELFFSEMSVV